MRSAEGETAVVRLRRGVLVAFEGIDGAGKTTQAQLLAQRLRDAGLPVVSTKEPTRGKHGTRLRASAAARRRLDAVTELEMFEADRREHVAEVIGPALKRCAVVVEDRYYFSTAAYQGARGLDPQDILARNEGFAPQPDLVILLDVPVKEALDRIRRRGDGNGNLFERERTLRQCAAIFKQIERPYLLRLDGTEPSAVIHAQVVQRLDEDVLFHASCFKLAYLTRCEPEHCSYRIERQCDYPLLGSLRRPLSLSTVDVNAIAEDTGLTPEEKLKRLTAALRTAR